MPKSKRNRIIHTSVVQKKPSKERGVALYENVQTAISSFAHIFVFDVANMRNTYLKSVRQNFSDSRIFFGKTKVMAKALGQTRETEHAPGLWKLNAYLKGSVGLLCTNRAPEEVLNFFAEYVEVDFARAGTEASRTVVIPAGVVYSRGGEVAVEDDVMLPHSLEVMVRKWGMPTRLDKGKVVLDQEYTVCQQGKELNSHQSALLKLFGMATADFKVEILAYWSAATSEVTKVDQDAGAMEEG
ncbi:related to mRNA turnover protein 4 [Ramularia collo-cygni]|uniref:Ribosome assembly factor mrt4 n=1 Tax=Ramularia collo-cygni TaxID=112498 RepID=A0A2D3VH11_9PEZI|nr:related to mRNA turnover protein 4 [Ramularia collo-cygni]CZT23471.1 related to mRNA turnover protein 4 [Ramularia collo-cygni]